MNDAKESKLYGYMLALINQERRRAGAGEVTLGNNRAAQVHADDCLDSGFVSHWSLLGLKPYVRYSLTGGYQNNGENWFEQEYFGNAYISHLEAEIDRSMEWLMNSPGHRATILDPWYHKVNLGLAYGKQRFIAIQHFEGDFVAFERMPTMVDGVLRMSGKLKDRIAHCDPEKMSVDIWFDPPPARLTVAQLLRVNGYDGGSIVGSVRRPLPPGYWWEQDQGITEVNRLRRPEDIPNDSTIPVSPEEKQAITGEAYEANQRVSVLNVTFPFITAHDWTVRGTHFSITANVGPVTSQSGPGIYSILLWCPLGHQREMINISRYSLLVDLYWKFRRTVARSLKIG